MLRLVTSALSADKKQNIPCPQKSTLVGELTNLWQPWAEWRSPVFDTGVEEVHYKANPHLTFYVSAKNQIFF